MNKLLYFILFTSVLIACQNNNSKKMEDNNSIPYTEKDILNELDVLHKDVFFIDLEHGSFYTAGNRIALFADSTRWAITLEKSGYHNRDFAGLIQIHYYGNCLINLPGENEKYNFIQKFIIKKEEINRIYEDYDLINKDAIIIKTRNTALHIEQNPDIYETQNIKLENYPLIDIPSLIRYLDEQNPELFRATDDELRTCLPKDLPKLMTIDKWYFKPYSLFSEHPDLAKPSSYETFQLIAKILVTKDTTLWKPTLKPNNDWRNYPDAGNL